MLFLCVLSFPSASLRETAVPRVLRGKSAILILLSCYSPG